MVTAASIFHYLNGFTLVESKNSPNMEHKSGFSMGSLSACNSLFYQLWEETLDLIVAVDRDLASATNVDADRRVSWTLYMEPALIPDVWPVKPLMPGNHLYGNGQFSKSRQTSGNQCFIIKRMVFLWARGIHLTGKGTAAMPMCSKSMATHCNLNQEPFLQFSTIFDQWKKSEEYEDKLRKRLAKAKAAKEAEDAMVLAAALDKADAEEDGAPMDVVTSAVPDGEEEPAVPIEDEGALRAVGEPLLLVEAIDEMAIGEYIDRSFRAEYANMMSKAHEALWTYPWLQPTTVPDEATTFFASVERYRVAVQTAREKELEAAAIAKKQAEDGKQDEDSGSAPPTTAPTPQSLESMLSQVGALEVTDPAEAKTEVDETALYHRQTELRLLEDSDTLLKTDHEIWGGNWMERFTSDKGSGKNKGVVSLVHLDPWYQVDKWPTDSDMKTLEEASNYYTKPSAIIVLWHPWMYAKRFANAFIKSGRWTVDNYVKKIVRAPNKIGRGGSANTQKGVTEQYMLLYKNQKGKRIAAAIWSAKTAMNTAQIVRWSGNPRDKALGRGGKQANDGFPWESDVLVNYKPPFKSQRLTDDEDNALRAGAEKSVYLMQQLLQMYTKNDMEGDHVESVWDPFGGSLSMGLACLTMGRRYMASEIMPEILKFSRRRLMQYVAARLRGSTNRKVQPVQLLTSDMSYADAQVITLLAERGLHMMALNMYPPEMGPKCGRDEAIAVHGGDLVVKKVPTTEATTKVKRPMGLGLYTTVDLEPGVSMRFPLFAYGKIVLEEDQAHTGATQHPIKFRSHLLDGLLLLPEHGCLMRYINDGRGTGLVNNVILIEGDVTTINEGEGYTMLEVRPKIFIPAGTQLCMNYGTTFFSDLHPDDPSKAVAGENKAEVKKKRKERRQRRKNMGTTAVKEDTEEEESDEEDDGENTGSQSESEEESEEDDQMEADKEDEDEKEEASAEEEEKVTVGEPSDDDRVADPEQMETGNYSHKKV
jgi:DNA modification methylase